MALPVNRSRRYLDLLARLFNAPEGIMRIGDISPGIALETEDAQELDLPRGWRRWGQVWSNAPAAGVFGEFCLDNPAASKTLIRIEALGVLTATAAAELVQIGLTSGTTFAGWTNSGSGGPLDGRNRTAAAYQVSAGTLYVRNTAAAVAKSRFSILFPTTNSAMLYASRPECRIVLDPGQQLLLSFNNLNVQQRVMLVWAERYFDSWEKFPNT